VELHIVIAEKYKINREDYNMPDLKPDNCPYCNDKNIIYKVRGGFVKKIGNVYTHFYKCVNCGASVPGADQFDALRKWNRRDFKGGANGCN